MKSQLNDLSNILSAAIDAVKPAALIPRAVHLNEGVLRIGTVEADLRSRKNVYVIGAGKASAYMAYETERILGDYLTGGIVTVKYGHTAPCKKIAVREAGHPVVDEKGIEATRKMLELVDEAKEEDLVICLLSGGGSALMELLPDDVPLEDLRQTVRLLLSSGATIDEMNSVRKHLSLVKGGRLARRIAPARCIGVIISDVIGDPVETIASGPTAPDTTTFDDAVDIIRQYDLRDGIPESIREYLTKGAQGNIDETVKPGDNVFENVSNIIIGNNYTALEAARLKGEDLGYNSIILTSRFRGEAREIAKVVNAVVEEIHERNIPVAKPACILLGGESTVTVRGKGKGGRNQELALSSLIGMKGADYDYSIACFGTDGTDGPTDAAGGLVTSEILRRAESLKLSPESFLENNDSYTFLEKADGLIVTGPTGTNVMDLIVALVKS